MGKIVRARGRSASGIWIKNPVVWAVGTGQVHHSADVCIALHCIDRSKYISPILWTGYFRRLTKSASAAVIT